MNALMHPFIASLPMSLRVAHTALGMEALAEFVQGQAVGYPGAGSVPQRSVPRDWRCSKHAIRSSVSTRTFRAGCWPGGRMT